MSYPFHDFWFLPLTLKNAPHRYKHNIEKKKQKTDFWTFDLTTFSMWHIFSTHTEFYFFIF